MIRSIVAVCALATVACATKTGPASADLGGREWRLVSVGGQGAQPANALLRPRISLAIDSRRVTGSLGCNRASGPFTLRGSELRFGPLVSTRMACADQAMTLQETVLARALETTDNYRIAGDTLELLQGTTVLAKFARLP